MSGAAGSDVGVGVGWLTTGVRVAAGRDVGGGVGWLTTGVGEGAGLDVGEGVGDATGVGVGLLQAAAIRSMAIVRLANAARVDNLDIGPPSYPS